jgi:xylan 1,4-beta-xylosidase
MKQRSLIIISTKIFVFLTSQFFCTNLYAQQLVLPGDYPDPSVVKIGDKYWASATTSNWAPAYPILESKDLVNWKTVGHVFANLPQWADFYFWAPEISYDNGKVYLYYAAHKKNGNLCVGVASADKPEGPYKDHGPLICQEVGSIDAFPMRDENGQLYLIWKEDANSVGKPTPIWAMPMNEERTMLTGEKKELFRNTETWEANLVEGVSMVRQGDYFYAFYAAAGCCGAACTYGVGIARSKNLLGPWEKYEKNPVLTGDEQWKCPGHGTPIEKDGRHYFMYHAYAAEGTVFTGRQGLLIEYKFTPDGWIEFVKDTVEQKAVIENTLDDFGGKRLSGKWQWSVFQNPQHKLKGGELYLPALPSASGSFLGQKTLRPDYTATATVHAKKSTATAGIAIIGDEKNTVSALYQNGVIKIVQLKNGKESELLKLSVPKKEKINLRLQVRNGKEVQFFYSMTGRDYKPLNQKSIDVSFLPPWDRAVRAGLVAKGQKNTNGVFDRFELKYF